MNKKSTKSRRPKQLFLDKKFNVKRSFGGSLLCNSNAKTARPISTKESMHIVLRSSLAKGIYSMLKNDKAKRIRQAVDAQAKRFHIKIYEFANVGNHLHILVKASHRQLFKSFLRAISGLIARITLGVEKGSAKGIKFWDQRPFTRIVSWANDFKIARSYVVQNFNEALGFVPYTPRKYKVKPVRRPDLV
jgi:REP element-mobilizing transposase RayT